MQPDGRTIHRNVGGLTLTCVTEQLYCLIVCVCAWEWLVPSIYMYRCCKWTCGQNTGQPLVESQRLNDLPRDKVSRSQNLNGCPPLGRTWHLLMSWEALGRCATISSILINGHTPGCCDRETLKSIHWGTRASEINNSHHLTFILLNILCENFSIYNFHLLGSKRKYFNNENKANYSIIV